MTTDELIEGLQKFEGELNEHTDTYEVERQLIAEALERLYSRKLDAVHKNRRYQSQRRQIRQLQRVIAEHRGQFQLSYNRIKELERQLQSSYERWHRDYRTVCRCWTCRLREWYNYRAGHTYPARKGWRFPFAGKWPMWD